MAAPSTRVFRLQNSSAERRGSCKLPHTCELYCVLSDGLLVCSSDHFLLKNVSIVVS